MDNIVSTAFSSRPAYLLVCSRASCILIYGFTHSYVHSDFPNSIF